MTIGLIAIFALKFKPLTIIPSSLKRSSKYKLSVFPKTGAAGGDRASEAKRDYLDHFVKIAINRYKSTC